MIKYATYDNYLPHRNEDGTENPFHTWSPFNRITAYRKWALPGCRNAREADPQKREYNLVVADPYDNPEQIYAVRISADAKMVGCFITLAALDEQHSRWTLADFWKNIFAELRAHNEQSELKISGE